jgi:hypothetical protein
MSFAGGLSVTAVLNSVTAVSTSATDRKTRARFAAIIWAKFPSVVKTGVLA